MKYFLFYNAYCEYIDEYAENIKEFDHKPTLDEVASYLGDIEGKEDEIWIKMVAEDIVNLGGSSDFYLEKL